MPVSPSAKYFGFSPRPAASYFQDSQSDPYGAVFSGYNPVQSQIEQQQAIDYGDLLAGNTDLDTEEGMSGLQRLLLGGKVSPQQARSAIYGQKYLNPTQRTTAARGPGRNDPYSPDVGEFMRQLHLLDPSDPNYVQNFQGAVKSAPVEAFTNPGSLAEFDRHQNNISQLRQKQAALAAKPERPERDDRLPLTTNESQELHRVTKGVLQEPTLEEKDAAFQDANKGREANGPEDYHVARDLVVAKRRAEYYATLKSLQMNGFKLPKDHESALGKLDEFYTYSSGPQQGASLAPPPNPTVAKPEAPEVKGPPLSFQEREQKAMKEKKDAEAASERASNDASLDELKAVLQKQLGEDYDSYMASIAKGEERTDLVDDSEGGHVTKVPYSRLALRKAALDSHEKFSTGAAGEGKKTAGELIEELAKTEAKRAGSFVVQAPQPAIDLLLKNPALAPQFDAKYGTGASKKFLK